MVCNEFSIKKLSQYLNNKACFIVTIISSHFILLLLYLTQYPLGVLWDLQIFFCHTISIMQCSYPSLPSM